MHRSLGLRGQLTVLVTLGCLITWNCKLGSGVFLFLQARGSCWVVVG